MKKLLILLISCFTAHKLLDFTCNRLIFHPVKHDYNDSFPNSIGEYKIKSSYINTPDEESIHYLFIENKKSDKIFLYAHGNGGNLYNRVNSSLCKSIKYLLNFGSVCIFDYRGYGMSSGNVSEEKAKVDIKTMWEHLLKTYDNNNIILYGSSLGCSFVSWLGSTLDPGEMPKCIILQSGFYNLKEIGKSMIGSCVDILSLFVSNDFDNCKYVKLIRKKSNDYPIIILHSKQDEIIPYDQSKNLAKETSSTFIEIFGDHNCPEFTEESDDLINRVITG